MRSDILSRRAALALALAAAVAATPALSEDVTGKIKIGVIGGGNIGGTIGGLWVKDGHEVMFASRHPENLKPSSTNSAEGQGRARRRRRSSSPTRCFWRCPTRPTGAVEGDRPLLKGKVVLDAGNATERRDGELYGEAQKNGIGLTTAKYFPGAKLVRAFNAANYKVFAKEGANGGKDRSGGRMAIPIAGDDQQALEVAKTLVRDAGFEPVVSAP